MGKDFEIMFQSIIADYLDGTLSKSETDVLELIINDDNAIRDYVQKVKEGSVILSLLEQKDYQGPYIDFALEQRRRAQ